MATDDYAVEDVAEDVAMMPMPDDLREALESRNLWKDKWRQAATYIQELRDEAEKADVALARLRRERDELRGERNEARRLLQLCMEIRDRG